jgi:hypothetical protein
MAEPASLPGQVPGPPADVAAMLAIPALTLADLLLPSRWAVWGIALVSLVFIVRHAAHVARPVRRTSAALVAVTALLLPLLPDPAAALGRGVRIGALIASLLVTINLLSCAVSRVPRARDLLESLHRVPPHRRYGVLSVASQFFGGLLGLAGITMMMESAARQPETHAQDKLSSFSAVTRGYAALSLWSPMYSNMSIVLAMYPGAHWAGVLPVALVVTALFTVIGIVLDRLSRPHQPASAATSAVMATDIVSEGWPVILGMLGFLAFMVLTSRGLRLPISAVIIAGAPAAAWWLNARMLRSDRSASRAAARLMMCDMNVFRGMAGEVMMFMASGCAGTVVGNAIPSAWTATIGSTVAGSPELACLTVSTAIVLLSAFALHPMLSAVIVGASLGPALLGLPELAHLSAVLVGWGLAIIVTPFSVVSALASRWSGIPVLVISLRANAVFVLLALGSSATLLGLLARLMTR